MKFAVILSLAACALAVPGTPVKRDGASISSAIAVVSASVVALDNQVNSYSGAGDTAALQAASDAVVSATNAGTATADASAPLSDLEAIGLVNPINALVAIVNTTVTDAINKKPTFDSAGASPAVLASLQQQRSAAVAFQTAVVNKLSDGLKDTGRSLSQPIIDSLDQGIAAFSAPSSTTTTPGATTTPSTTPAGPSTTPAGPSTTPAGPSTTPAGPSTTPSTTPAGPSTTPAGPSTTPAQPPTTSKNPPPTTSKNPPPPPTTTPVAPPTTSKYVPPTTLKTSTTKYGYGGSSSWGNWGHETTKKQSEWGHQTTKDWGHETTKQWSEWGHKTTTTTTTTTASKSKSTGWGHWN